MDELESLRHLRVTLLFTYSGITHPRVEPIAKSRITVTSIRTACARKQRTGVVLYWRPIVPGRNDHPATMAHVLHTGCHADAIVFTGYYHKPENAVYLREQGVPLPSGEHEHHRRKARLADLDTAVAAWCASGITTPLFRKTSCGVAYAHAAPDYNGHCPSARHFTALRDDLTDQMRYTDDQYRRAGRSYSPMTSSNGEWATAPLVALDLEGSGAQDHDHEAILEIAVVPITAGQPDAASAYTTLINPGHPIRRRPRISPALTTAVLAAAPTPAAVGPELARRINGQIIVGHNVGVDWRLLHRRYPAITPTALIDTLRLARHLKLGTKNSLTALTARLDLTPQIERLATGSQPHRALWDTIAAALLLRALIARAWPEGASLADLLDIAAIDTALPGPPGQESQLGKTASSARLPERASSAAAARSGRELA